MPVGRLEQLIEPGGRRWRCLVDGLVHGHRQFGVADPDRLVPQIRKIGAERSQLGHGLRRFDLSEAAWIPSRARRYALLSRFLLMTAARNFTWK